MKILDVLDVDSVNYKKLCMTIMFPYCSFKCNKDAGTIVCQNYQSKGSELIDVEINELIKMYVENPLTEAIVMQGFEPFDSYNDLYALIYEFTRVSKDDIVIYTGYNKSEIQSEVLALCDLIECNNLIIKFGRYVPNDISVFDETLGVTLSSSNQYAEVVNSRKGKFRCIQVQ